MCQCGGEVFYQQDEGSRSHGGYDLDDQSIVLATS